jgi:hypothetical protein
VEAWWDSHAKRYFNDTPSRSLIERHPDRFMFEVLSPQVAIETVEKLILRLREHGHREQKILLTVSPVPFGRTFTHNDVITANTYSKSLLRVAAEVASRKFDWVDYYPSFESITHTDRNAAWEDDLIHVKQPIVNANVERMLRSYIREQAE